MARPIHRLTTRAVQAKVAPGYHPDGAGLYLQVTVASGGGRVASSARSPAEVATRSWIFRFKFQKQPRELGLGSARVVGLAQARELAAQCRRDLQAGQDPLALRRESLKAQTSASAASASLAPMSFDDCAQAYINAHRDGWRNAKHAAQWESTVRRHASPVIGKLPPDQVTLQHVLHILEPMWRVKTETASRLRGRIESVLDWATVRGFRTGDNPARWRGHLEQLLPMPSKVARVEHHPALKIDEMPGFMVALRQPSGLGALALQFLVLTAARSGEVRGATWEEIDIAQGQWTVPGIRMKSGREHRVALSTAAIGLLQELPSFESRQGLVFAALKGGQLSDMTLTAVMRRLKLTAVPHGFRSTFRDWCAERTEFPRDVAEMALAHAIGDKVEAAYRRGDLFEKRRQMMQAWAAFLGE